MNLYINKLIAVRYSRNWRSISHSSTTKDRCDSMSPPSPDECPPKMRCLMDLYPVPCGSWKENYDAKNVIYNRQLVVAIGTLVITLFTVCFTKNDEQ